MLTVKLILLALCALVGSSQTEPRGTVSDNDLYITLAEKLEHLERQRQEDKQQWQQEKEHLQNEIAQLKSRCRLNNGKKPKEAEQPVSRLHSRQDASALEPVISEMNQRLDELGAEVEALKNADVQQASHIQEAASSTFVRWGSSSCSNSTELVYSGVVGGGGHYHSTGVPTSVHCLPLNPVLSNSTIPRHYADLHGGEYQTYVDNHYNKDPVCAVCRTPRSTNIMVPATNQCEDGWNLEYTGYFMGSSTEYSGAHDSICMDIAMEESYGSAQSSSALLFYYTFTVCGSLPCPPYEDRQLVLCAVCSK